METEEKELICKTCKHYRQHYVKFGYRYGEVHCGHCVYPMLKTRAPSTKACKHYKEKTL